MRMILLLLLAATTAQAQGPITVLERRELSVEQGLASPAHRLRLTIAQFKGSGWSEKDIVDATAQASAILGQCGIALYRVELVVIEAESRFHVFHTPASRELARTLSLGKPTVYFVAGTRQRPAFDAEAIGRGNSRTRPELADTVWVTLATRDLGIALAHELAHVLMDSGEHSEEPGNLMREKTAPENTRLSEAQCAQLRDNGSANGLLKAP